ENSDFSLGWTLQRSKNKEMETLWEAEDGSQRTETKNILRTPNNYGYFVWNYARDKWGILLNGTYTGKMEVPHLIDPETEHTIIEESQDFFDLGVRMHYQVPVKKSYIELFGGVKNVLNEYQSDFDAGINRDAGYIYGPAMPRVFYLGLKLKG
ncbi:MAG: TonB-dependent receptor, partial [Bacteroidota bacterium]